MLETIIHEARVHLQVAQPPAGQGAPGEGPADKIKNWQSDETSCSFTVDPIGNTGVKIIEKEPYKLIKLTNLEESNMNFTFWVQLKMLSETDTRIKLTLEANLNPVIQTMAKKPLQEFLDKLVDQLTKYSF